jgi:hypothetical protein
VTEEATIEVAGAATGVGVVLMEEEAEGAAPTEGAEAALMGAEEVVAVIVVVEEGAATEETVRLHRPLLLQAQAGRGVRKSTIRELSETTKCT